MEAHGLSHDTISRFLAEFAALAEPIEVHFSWRPVLVDANDEIVLEAAVNGRAEALVTHNVKDFLPSVRRFSVPVLTPAMCIRELR